MRAATCAIGIALSWAGVGGAYAGTDPVFHRIALSGGAYPGRPGYSYSKNIDLAFAFSRAIDRDGDVYFTAYGDSASSPSVRDMLRYRPATGAVEPFVRENDLVAGLSMRPGGPVGGPEPGLVAHNSILGGFRTAVVVSRGGGSDWLAAISGDQPPGYPEPASWLEVGLTGLGAVHVNMNRAGAVAFGASFRDSAAVTQFGYYSAPAGGAAARALDTTQPVPGHPGAKWVPYDNGIYAFDTQGAGIDDAGNVYFRAKYELGGKAYRVFYRRSTDGTVTPLVDGGVAGEIPGRPAGSTYGAIKQAMNNRSGDVAYMAEVFTPGGVFWGTGVYLSRGGGPWAKVADSGDAVAGIPDATAPLPAVAGMNDSGDVLLSTNHALATPVGTVRAYSLTLHRDAGPPKLVMRFDQLPGLPGVRATILNQVELNERGDVVFTARLSTSTAGDDRAATFAYLNDTGTLVPILKTGDTLDGMKIVKYLTLAGVSQGGFEPSASAGVTGGSVLWDDERRLTINAVLEDAGGVRVAGVYAVSLPRACAADCSADQRLDIADFVCFQNAYALGEKAKADVGGAAGCSADGALSILDFSCFQNLFALGCP